MAIGRLSDSYVERRQPDGKARWSRTRNSRAETRARRSLNFRTRARAMRSGSSVQFSGRIAAGPPYGPESSDHDDSWGFSERRGILRRDADRMRALFRQRRYRRSARQRRQSCRLRRAAIASADQPRNKPGTSVLAPYPKSTEKRRKPPLRSNFQVSSMVGPP